MKIGSINHRSNFKGAYFLTSDIHAKPVSSVSLFQKIGDSAKTESSSIYIDNGDFYSDKPELMTQIFTTFVKKNKNIQPVLNLGNCEFFDLYKNTSEILSNIDKLVESGINVISTPLAEIYKEIGLNKEQIHNIKPYVILKDDIDGETKDILVVGTADIRQPNILDTKKQAEILTSVITEARKKHNPYKTVLVSHNALQDTKKILDILNEKGINDIELVSGGHSHRIEDEVYHNARILHSAPQGLSAYKIKSDKNGFHIKQINYDKVDRYNYAMQGKQNNDDIIDNLAFEPDKLDKDYLNIIKSTDLLEEITECTTNIKGREAGYEVSYPSEFGTMMTNKMKEKTGADLAIMLSQDIRGRMPEIGKKIYKYNILDILNVDKKLWILNVNKEELFDIFNVSLKKQHDGSTNSDFLEFSNNIILERYTDIPDEEVNNTKRDLGKIGKPEKQRIKEIYIKQGEEYIPISSMNKDNFSVACCSFLATAGRPSLSYINNINNKKEWSSDKVGRKFFTEALKEIQETKIPVKKAVIIDCKTDI